MVNDKCAKCGLQIDWMGSRAHGLTQFDAAAYARQCQNQSDTPGYGCPHFIEATRRAGLAAEAEQAYQKNLY
jgi:hypothetical protein